MHYYAWLFPITVILPDRHSTTSQTAIRDACLLWVLSHIALGAWEPKASRVELPRFRFWFQFGSISVPIPKFSGIWVLTILSPVHEFQNRASRSHLNSTLTKPHCIIPLVTRTLTKCSKKTIEYSIIPFWPVMEGKMQFKGVRFQTIPILL